VTTPQPIVNGNPAAARPRSLLPQEHGAWGQLAMPIASALLVGRPAPAALLLAAATVLAFLAHEPFLVLLGHRGKRAQGEDGTRARRLVRLLLCPAVACGAAGAWLAPWPARLALVASLALMSIVIALVLAKRERTVPGELTVVTTLALSGLAIALAGGAPLRVAAAVTVTWVLAFAASVFAVQVVLEHARSRGGRGSAVRNALAAVLVTGLGSGAAVRAGLGWVVPVAVAPPALLSVAVCLANFSPKHLRRLGWSLVAATSTTLLVLAIGLRAP